MKILWLVCGVPRNVAALLGYSAAVVQGSWVDRLATAVDELGADVMLEVFCLSELEFDIRVAKVRYFSIKNVFKGWSNSWKHCRINQALIKEKIHAISPDLIHIHGTEHIGGDFDISTYDNVPVVVSIQGVISQCHIAYTGGLSPYDVRIANLNLRTVLKRTTMFSEQNWWRKERSEIEQRIFKKFRFFIGRTEWDRSCLEYYNPEARYFAGEESLHPIFSRLNWSRESAKRHVIFCGNALGYGLKGGHWLIKAVAQLKREFPDIQLRIAAADKRISQKRTLMQKLKSDTYTLYIRRLIRQLDCADCIVGLPPLSPEEVARELVEAEVFVLPSVCENSPNSLCEAMMVGTPAIATFTGGIPSIMRDGVEGHLVPVCDSHALAGAIRRHFRDHAYAESCIIAAKEKARLRHDEVNNARTLLGIYTQILREERRA